ncbi:MAG: amphi-Trp domain-containing protein [Deltaproteobacteria bacterium]|jgi:amphi-Trp domain-containing protein|nr:amphi-Trp domain-containing protein [Deltaproteobacteria bacterium]
MSKNNFRHSFVTDPDDVARYLESLISGFKEGVLSFSSQHRKVHLEPAKILDMSIETSIRKGKVRLTISFTWPDEAGPQLQSLPLDNHFHEK